MIFEALFKGVSTRFGLRIVEKSVDNPDFIFCSSFQNLRLVSINVCSACTNRLFGEHAVGHHVTRYQHTSKTFANISRPSPLTRPYIDQFVGVSPNRSMQSTIASTHHEGDNWGDRAKKRPRKAPVEDVQRVDPEMAQMKVCDFLLCLIESRLLERRGNARCE
jgi:hypothetical protein